MTWTAGRVTKSPEPGCVSNDTRRPSPHQVPGHGSGWRWLTELSRKPGRAERRSGVPAEVITSDRVPNSCTCSWAYSQGKLTLKHYNAACPVHLAMLGR